MDFIPFELFISAFISFFVIVDPFGTAAVFISLTQRLDKAVQKQIAFKAVAIAIAILIMFCLIGDTLLSYMHVSIDAFRVTGGLLLFVTAFRMIMGFHDPDQMESESASYKDHSTIAVFPLAIPLLAGPGTITAAMLFTAEAQTTIDYTVIFATIIIVQAIALISLLGAGRLAKFFGPTGNSIIARLMGILLAAMAVQFIADGIKGIFSL
jgi:multiple antibiotic resistance protein